MSKEQRIKGIEGIIDNIGTAHSFLEEDGSVGEKQYYDVNKKRLATAIEEAIKVDEDLIKELKLLKSYFEDSREVLLHVNDIKWEHICKAITKDIIKVGEGK